MKFVRSQPKKEKTDIRNIKEDRMLKKAQGQYEKNIGKKKELPIRGFKAQKITFQRQLLLL